MPATALHPPLRPLARRVSLLGTLFLVAALLGVSLYMSVELTAREHDRVDAWVGEKTRAIADSADAFDATSRVLVDKFYSGFAASFAPAFHLDAATGTLTNGGAALNGDFTQVDAFAQRSGGNATVFARQGDDFVRVSTSVKNEKGERAVGTMLDRKSPAYPDMIAGKTYVGRTMLFGKPFMTRYEPIREDGQVVGILYIGFDLSAFQASFEKLVAGTRFFDTGGVYVIDPKKATADAVFVAHPADKGRKVLEAVPDGAALMAAIEGAGDAAVASAPAVLRAGQDDSFLIARRSAATGWWVVAEVSTREAMHAHWMTMARIWTLMAATALLLGLGLRVMIGRWVARPLGQLTESVAAMARGDMTQSIHSTQACEIGRLVRDVEQMRLRLHGVLGVVRTSADSVATGSAQIAAGNADLSARTEAQAANLQQTAAAMTELATAITRNAETARQATTIAEDARAAAARGGEVVGGVVQTMQEIAASSEKIGAIIGVIDGLAFQTNLLALNAAVEAARAGEQGRGFAVVAGEVRNLAQRSASAAQEIKGLVGESVGRVATGVDLVDAAGRSVHDIVTQVGRVNDLIAAMSAAGGRQATEIGQVGAAVDRLDAVTQQNAALVEESAAAADSLQQQADRLVDAAAVFRLAA
jgi:methyl-accepting chemotaxis protein-2 (aspartate sensor receptor)